MANFRTLLRRLFGWRCPYHTPGCTMLDMCDDCRRDEAW